MDELENVKRKVISHVSTVTRGVFSISSRRGWRKDAHGATNRVIGQRGRTHHVTCCVFQRRAIRNWRL